MTIMIAGGLSILNITKQPEISVADRNVPKMDKGNSFSFTEIRNSEKVDIGDPSFIAASDGVRLACYPVKAKKPIAGLVFIHGGGAYSLAGYQFLAKDLSEKHQISVYLIDLRGHGNSEGPRGDAPFPEQVFQDLQLLLEFVKQDNPKSPVYLGGHSSGGGLVLNYSDWNSDSNISGYIFISPEFGYKSKTARKNIKKPFAKVNLPLFIINGVSDGKLYGNTHAVFFNYPERVIKEQPLIIRSITCNMSKALTPDNPQGQFSKINKPFGLFIGAQDELFEPEKVIGYAELPEKDIKESSVKQIVENENHLSILKIADKLIGYAIVKMNGKF